MKEFKIFIATLIGLIFLGIRIEVSAQTFNFSVNPEFPETQVKEHAGYYDLILNPGQKQILHIQLENITNQAIVIKTDVAEATTNNSGVVEYIHNEIKPDKSLQIDLSAYTTFPKEVTVPAKSTKTIDITVEMPNKKIEGQLAAGISFIQKDEGNQATGKKNDADIKINNHYQYVLGLLAKQNTHAVAPDLTLHTVEASLANYRNIISANVQNFKPAYLHQMQVVAEVTKKGDSTVNYKLNQANMNFAPNSNFNVQIPVSDPMTTGYNQPLKAGTYTLEMSIYGEQSDKGQYEAKTLEGKTNHYNYRWHFTREFTVTPNEAEKLNKEDVTIKHEEATNYWWFLLLLLIPLFVALASWVKYLQDRFVLIDYNSGYFLHQNDSQLDFSGETVETAKVYRRRAANALSKYFDQSEKLQIKKNGELTAQAFKRLEYIRKQ